LVNDPMQAVWFVVMFLVIQQIEGNLIYPKVVGNSIGLSGMWVIAAISIGGDLFGVVGMLLMIPFFWKIADTEKFRFKFPFLVTLLSFCSNACMLTPGLYAMGISGAGRTLNIVKLWFVLLVFVNEAYWLGYLKRKLGNKFPEKRIDVRIWTSGILILIFIAFAANVERRAFDYSSYAAYVSLRSGEASQYHKEHQDRVELLTGEEKVVELKPFSVKPYLLYFDDITTNIYDWRNTAVARWYGKEIVWLRE